VLGTTASYAIVRRTERAVLVEIMPLVGLPATIFIVGEFFGPSHWAKAAHATLQPSAYAGRLRLTAARRASNSGPFTGSACHADPD